MAAANADFERARIDLERREALAGSGAISGDELTKTRNAYASAEANVRAAIAAQAQSRANYAATIGSREANAVLIANTTEDTNPEVTLARARRDQARVNLPGLVDRTGETARTLANTGLSSDAVRSALDNMAQSQSVMLATNELLLIVAVAFAIAAAVIWLAPRPTRKVDMTQAGH